MQRNSGSLLRRGGSLSFRLILRMKGPSLSKRRRPSRRSSGKSVICMQSMNGVFVHFCWGFETHDDSPKKKVLSYKVYEMVAPIF